jgi:hypothetical protein
MGEMMIRKCVELHSAKWIKNEANNTDDYSEDNLPISVQDASDTEWFVCEWPEHCLHHSGRNITEVMSFWGPFDTEKEAKDFSDGEITRNEE